MTGIIKTETIPVIFSVQEKDFCFSFITDAISKSFENIEILTPDGLMYGTTFDDYDIGIYTGTESFKFFGKSGFNTAAYIISSSNSKEKDITEFDSISFEGGTLNKVFHINGMNIEHTKNKIGIIPNDDSIDYTFLSPNGSIRVHITSVLTETFGEKGSSVNNNSVVLTLFFDNPQPLSSIFEYYNSIKDMLSFLTFRYNVGFDKVYTSKNGQGKNTNVYIRKDYELTAKSPFFNIHLNDIKEVLPQLTTLFFNTEENCVAPAIGFCPIDEESAFVSDSTLREVCTALERELEFIKDIKAEENILLSKLIDKTRIFIKSFRKENPGLSNDTYNRIFSSVGYWSFSLTEKLCALYKKYEKEMLAANKSNLEITDKHIKAFVKYRNDITHGRHRVLDVDIAVTTHCMCCLVYCCVLDRIGVSREKIFEMCKLKLLK